jgi:hypothetical protein
MLAATTVSGMFSTLLDSVCKMGVVSNIDIVLVCGSLEPFTGMLEPFTGPLVPFLGNSLDSNTDTLVGLDFWNLGLVIFHLFFNVDFVTRSLVSEYGIRMSINKSGNIGIGTTSPASKLEVASGQIYAPNGTSELPSYAFSNYRNSGMYYGPILNNFVSSVSGDKNIVLEEVSGNLKVSTKHSHSLIKCMPIDDFPIIPKVAADVPLKFNINDFLKGLKSVVYSTSTSTIRPALSSVFINSEEESVVFAATDSFRLAEKKIKTVSS